MRTPPDLEVFLDISVEHFASIHWAASAELHFLTSHTAVHGCNIFAPAQQQPPEEPLQSQTRLDMISSREQVQEEWSNCRARLREATTTVLPIVILWPEVSSRPLF